MISDTALEWVHSKKGISIDSYNLLEMIFGKIFLKKSFESGLNSLKLYLESKPQERSSLGLNTIEIQQALHKGPYEALIISYEKMGHSDRLSA